MGLNLEFYIWKDGREQGPFSPETLNKAIRLGSVSPQTPAWTNQDPSWRSVSEILKTIHVTERTTETALPNLPVIPLSSTQHRSILKSGKGSLPENNQLKIGLAAVAGFCLLLIFVIIQFSNSASSGSDEAEVSEDATTEGGDENESPELPDNRQDTDIRIAVTIEEAEKCVLMARSGESSGTAFIAQDKGKYYVYTNVHVASYRNLEFRDFRGRTVEISSKGEVVGSRANSSIDSGIDIVRFPLASSTEYALRFASRTTIEKRPHVWTLGDSGGESILKTLPGRIKGVGPAKIEVDCEFIQGNSGGPIVTSSAEVCGIASYMTTDQTIWAKGTEQEIRRMAWIPGTDHFWKETSLAQLEDEGSLVDNCLNTSGILWVLLRLQTADSGFLIPEDLPEGTEEVRDFLATVSPHPLTDFNSLNQTLNGLKKSGKSTQEALHLEYKQFFDKCVKYQGAQLEEAERKVTSSFWTAELQLMSQKDMFNSFENKTAKFHTNGQVGDILIELE